MQVGSRVIVLDNLSPYYEEEGVVIVYNEHAKQVMVEFEEEDNKPRLWFHLEDVEERL